MKKLKKWTTLLAVAVFVMLVIPQWTLSVSATEVSGRAGNGNIASGKDNNITWVIDANGKLTISGSGDFSSSKNNWNRRTVPWDSYKNDIKSAVCNVTGMTNASELFYGCANMTSVDLSRFDTSHVTDMSGMFWGCSGLTSLDVSHFDTSNVTDMHFMFSECSSLTSLDLSNFDTSNVEVLYDMFSGCSNLTNLDLSGFNTSKVEDMSGIFSECESLLNIDLSSFDFSNVSEVEYIFSGCSSLTSLDLSSWDMTPLGNSYNYNGEWIYTGFFIYEFGDANNLQTIYTPYNLNGPMTLPGTGWHLADGTEITELPKNLSSSIMVTRKPLDNNEQNDKNDDNLNGDDKDNHQPGAISGVLEGTGSTTDSAIYGKRLLTANPTDYKTILLSWDAVPGAKSYEIFYSTSPDSGFKRLANVKKTSCKFSKAKCGVTYYFQMRVCKKGGVKSEFGPISYGKTDLSSSAILQVKKTTYNSVTLKWSKVTGAKRYEIYYADSIDGDWQYLGVKGGTSFTHKRLVTGATYYYQIRPIRDSFHGGWSNGVSATTVLGNVSNLKVKAAGVDQMKITWRKVRGVNQYVIKRSESIDGEYEVIGYSDRASYRDTGLKSGTTYFYKVSAVSGPYRTKDTEPVGQMTKIPK